MLLKRKRKRKRKRGERQKATEAMNGAWCNFQAKQNSTAMRHKHKHTCTKGHRERARERGLKQPPHKSTTRANNSHTTFLSPNTHPKTTKQRQRQQQTAASILARGTIQLPHCPHCGMHAMFERRLLMHEHPWPVFNRETKGQEVKQQCVCVCVRESSNRQANHATPPHLLHEDTHASRGLGDNNTRILKGSNLGGMVRQRQRAVQVIRMSEQARAGLFACFSMCHSFMTARLGSCAPSPVHRPCHPR